MWDFDYSNTDSIKNLLYSNGLSMQKKFGQNFLISPVFQQNICKAALDGVDAKELWEVGPGFGALTHQFVKSGKKVKVFEIDNGFINILKTQAFTNKEIDVVEGDVLKTIFEQTECPPLLVGNLPYNIGTPLILEILKKSIAGKRPDKMVFLLQKECALKFISCESSKDYNPLAFSANLLYDVKIPFNVGRGAFFPSPAVESSLLVFTKKPDIATLDISVAAQINFAKALFSNPRKTVYNNLLKICLENATSLNKSSDKNIQELLKLRPAQLNSSNILKLYALMQKGK